MHEWSRAFSIRCHELAICKFIDLIGQVGGISRPKSRIRTDPELIRRIGVRIEADPGYKDRHSTGRDGFTRCWLGDAQAGPRKKGGTLLRKHRIRVLIGFKLRRTTRYRFDAASL